MITEHSPETINSIMVIWQWLAAKDPLQKADIIFLFGAPSLDTPKKGLLLYNDGWAPRFIAAGKLSVSEGNPFGDKALSEAYADFLVNQGVPESALLLEKESTNTQQDIQHTIPVLEEKGITCDKVILVTRSFHQKRAYATFRKEYPQKILINCPADEVSKARLEGNALAYIGNQCVQEYEKLIKYADGGFLEPQPIPENVDLRYKFLKAAEFN